MSRKQKFTKSTWRRLYSRSFCYTGKQQIPAIGTCYAPTRNCCRSRRLHIVSRNASRDKQVLEKLVQHTLSDGCKALFQLEFCRQKIIQIVQGKLTRVRCARVARLRPRRGRIVNVSCQPVINNKSAPAACSDVAQRLT
jgi:hypothetical protein